MINFLGWGNRTFCDVALACFGLWIGALTANLFPWVYVAAAAAIIACTAAIADAAGRVWARRRRPHPATDRALPGQRGSYLVGASEAAAAVHTVLRSLHPDADPEARAVAERAYLAALAVAELLPAPERTG